MKTNTVILIVLILVILIVTGYAIYAYNKRKEEEIEAQRLASTLGLLTSSPRPTGKFWDLLGAFFPVIPVLFNKKDTE